MITKQSTKAIVTLAFVCAVLLAGAAMPVAASPVQSMSSGNTAQNDSTSTPTATPTPEPTATPNEACDPRAGGPKLQQARLYSPRPTITGDQHGKIAGSLALDIQNQCPVVVQITMSVPTGMYVAGAADLSSGGGGLLTSTFVLQPGETKSLRANVYSNTLGEKTVTSDITYFPKGHKDMAREVDGIMLNFDVQEKNMPTNPNPPEETPTPTPSGPGGDGPTIIQWLLGIVSVSVIGLLLLSGLGMVSIRGAVPDEVNVRPIFKKNK